MPLLDYRRRTGPAGGTNRAGDGRSPGARPGGPGRGGGQDFWRRHLWPPSLPGLLLIAVVLSVAVGLIAGLVFAQSQAGRVELQDPAGPDPIPEVTVPLRDEVESTTTTAEPLSVAALADRVAPSVWRVSTFDSAGRPVDASAVVAGSFGGRSFLLTSFAAVRASTTDPGPPLVVRNGGTEAEATLWTWQEELDLALLVISRSAPPLKWAGEDPEGREGDRVFVAAEGAGLQPGTILATSPVGIEINVVIDERKQGGALVNERGEVLGMVSRAYDPGGVATDRVFVAVPMRAACGQVLQCGDGNATVGTTTTTAR